MYSFFSVFTRDRDTYYDSNSNKRISRKPTLLVYGLLAVVFATLIWSPNDTFLSGVLSAEAILVGFSFNVLLYLVANRLTVPAKFTSLEHTARFKRLLRLSSELVDNVSYFNLVAIIGAIVCIILMLIDAKSICTWAPTLDIALKPAHKTDTVLVSKIIAVAEWALFCALLFLLIEGFHTFIRAVLRVSFFFTLSRTMADKSEKRRRERAHDTLAASATTEGVDPT